MAISVNDTLPNLKLYIAGAKGPEEVNTESLFSSKKIVLFALPGAFTPGCSQTHLPGYVVNADKIKAKGVDHIICLSVNDAFVMGAWAKDQNAEEIIMLADGNGEFTKAAGLELDGSGFGIGMRSQRYALIAENGVVTHLNVEEGAGVDASAADKILALL